MGNRIVTTLKKLGHITDFVCAKQLLETMRSLVTYLQDSFVSIHIYNETRKKDDELFQFQRTYAKTVSFANNLVLKRNSHNHVKSR